MFTCPVTEPRRARITVVCLACALLGAARAAAEPVTSSTPNIETALVEHPWGLDFVFSHQFYDIGPKVLNSPTFTLALGLFPHVEAALRYATSSDIAGRVNELEPFVKVAALSQSRQLVDLTLVAAYNRAANSGDGAIVLGRRFGPVSLLGIAKGFTAGFGFGGPTAAAGGGIQLHINRFLLAEADANHVLAARYWSDIEATSDRWNWSAGIAFLIPYTPHTMSLYVTNGNTQTLEGSSRGTSTIRVGFAFEVPFDGMIGRLRALALPPPDNTAPASQAAAAGATKEVAMQSNAFQPSTVTVRAGTTVRWVNRDPVAHTVTASDKSWDSGVLHPDESWSHRFDTPGTYPYMCTLHPFMKGTVVVTAAAGAP